MKKDLAVIILAAGKSTRMKSGMPKVLHPICGRPVLAYVLDLVKSLKPAKAVAVLGYKHEEVRKIVPAEIKAVIQKNLIGTADAVKQAMPHLKGFRGTVLVLYGDTPLLKLETIKKLLERHNQNNLGVTLLTVNLEKPGSYGRILRDQYSTLCGIVEAKDANDFQKDIKEINTGIICFDAAALLRSLKNIRPDNRKKEYYLTDAIGIIYKSGGQLGSVTAENINEALGINSRLELAEANKVMQSRVNEKFMLAGVSIVDPASTFISYGTKIGQDTTIYPFTVIDNGVKIGKRCSVGPFAHLREGSCLENDVVVGNFLEIVRSRLSNKTWAKHFCYLGDSRIGAGVNIGAGTVIANFDGVNKNVTTIKDKAFIGCDTVLVSPVVIGKSARTGAGSVVTKNTKVADNSLVVGVPAKPLKSVRGK